MHIISDIFCLFISTSFHLLNVCLVSGKGTHKIFISLILFAHSPSFLSSLFLSQSNWWYHKYNILAIFHSFLSFISQTKLWVFDAHTILNLWKKISLFSGFLSKLVCKEGQFLCNNTLSNTILSINEWNYEVRKHSVSWVMAITTL